MAMPTTIAARETTRTPPSWTAVHGATIEISLPPVTQTELELGIKRFVGDPILMLPWQASQNLHTH